MIREAISKVAPGWYTHDLFPLTPALSLRARAGVRGNRSCEYQLGATFEIASRIIKKREGVAFALVRTKYMLPTELQRGGFRHFVSARLVGWRIG